MAEDPRIDPADLRNVRFPGSSRRYDARSVDQFLETVAARIAATNDLIDELRRDLADARTATPTAPAPATPELSLLDDDALVRLVGDETANVLSTARRAAEEIRSKAEESAARMIREATAEADRLTEDARRRAAELTAEAQDAHARATAEAEEAAARIRQEATDAAERLVAEQRAAVEAEQAAIEAQRVAARAEAEAVVEQAREEGRGMVAEARDVRARILEDLQRRRDAAREHIELLLAGRERLLAAYAQVRENLDDITGRLADALPDPGDPDLPDGFAGIVGTQPVPPADGADGAELDDTVAPAADQPDDTTAPVAPASDAPDTTGGSGTRPAAADAAADAPVAESTPNDDSGDDVGHDGADDGPGSPADDVATADLDEVPPAIAEDDPPMEEVARGPEASPVDEDLHADGQPVEVEPVEAGSVEVDSVEAEPQPAGDVDALFARLRAEREESVSRAQRVLAEDTGDVTGDGTAEEPPVTAVQADEPAQVPPAVDLDRVPAELLADPEDLEWRAHALAPLRDALNRSLKRRLANDQNELLDRLRRLATTDPADLLPAADEQVTTYARAAEPHLAAAATAAGGSAAAGEELAAALGRTLVEPFRRRVERASGDVEDADELDERLRALYREWKVQHIGPAAEDALLSAYARGVLDAAGDGSVRWRIDPGQGPCPDAQDNALAGAVPAGERFPTGDRCPQAHPGCRCVLVVDGT